MLLNFITPPDQDPSTKWRNLFASLVIVLGVGLSIGPHIGLAEPVIAVSNKILPKFVPSYKAHNVIGGDINIEPPRPIPLPPPVPILIGELPLADTFTAKSIFVKDRATNKVLYSKEEYSSRPLASITKLMSALVLLERPIDWTTTSTAVSGELADNHVYEGEEYTLEDLWNASLVASSNRSIMTLVQASGWEEVAFVERMNQKAAELGMTNTHFFEPTGLDESNVSTASDISILLDEALKNEKIVSTLLKKEYNLDIIGMKADRHIWTTNWLLLGWVPQNTFTILGGKTGYIPAAGYNFTMQVKNDAGKELNVIILGAEVHEERFTEARDVADAIYKAYQWPGEEENAVTPPGDQPKG